MNIALDPPRRAPIASPLAALAAVTLTATTSMAATEQNLTHTTVVVHSADLDVDSAAGREILLKRINHATSRVCEHYRYDRLRIRSFTHCKRESLRSVLLQLGLAEGSLSSVGSDGK